LNEANLTNVDLSDYQLYSAQMEDATLIGAYLSRADVFDTSVGVGGEFPE